MILIVKRIFFSLLFVAPVYGDIIPYLGLESVTQVVRKNIVDNHQYIDRDTITVEVTNSHVFEIYDNAHYMEFRIKPTADVVGKVTIPLSLYDKNKKLIFENNAIVKSTAKGKFVVLNETINKNDIITPENVREIKDDISSSSKYYFHSMDEVIGKQATSRIMKNNRLANWMLKKKSDILAGDQVTVLVKDSSFQIKTSGKSLESGAIGDLIRVKTQFGAKVLKGVILDSKNIEVSMSY